MIHYDDYVYIKTNKHSGYSVVCEMHNHEWEMLQGYVTFTREFNVPVYRVPVHIVCPTCSENYLVHKGCVVGYIKPGKIKMSFIRK